MPSMFKWFGKCFFCGGKENLSIVTHHGIYEWTRHYHYHPACVRRVLDHPEEHPDQVDTAIAIMDKINERMEELRREGETRRQGLERAWNTLRQLDNIVGSTDGNNRTGSLDIENNAKKETQHV